MGCCCAGMYKTINLNTYKEISVLPEKNENEKISKSDINNNKNPIEVESQNIPKSDKEDAKKESPNTHQNDKNDNKKIKSPNPSITPKTNIEIEKVNKNKVIKKGSQRVQRAMKELKLLSMKELGNHQRYFTEK